jgi:hypothetical protein
LQDLEIRLQSLVQHFVAVIFWHGMRSEDR